jgi:hypothetical protein
MVVLGHDRLPDAQRSGYFPMLVPVRGLHFWASRAPTVFHIRGMTQKCLSPGTHTCLRVPPLIPFFNAGSKQLDNRNLLPDIILPTPARVLLLGLADMLLLAALDVGGELGGYHADDGEACEWRRKWWAPLVFIVTETPH